MTLEEFGKKIKEKYPQYQDVSDAELGQKMLIRYPQYNDMVTVTKTVIPKKDALTKTSDVLGSIFGGKQIGESIGTLAGYGYQKGKDLIKGTDVASNYDLSAPSPLQTAGDAVRSLVGVAGVKGVGTTGSFLAKAGKSALIGAGITGGGAVSEGKGLKDVVKETAIGAGVGASTSLALSGVGAIASQFKKLPSRFIQSALGQSKKEILAGKSLEKFILENRKVGTADKLIRESRDEMERLTNIINNNLKSVPVTQGKVTTSSILNDIVKDVNAQGGAITREEAREIVERLAPQAKGLLSKPSMGLVTANKLRQSIDRTIGDRGFLVSELPFNKDVLRSFTNALREEVKKKAPEGTRAAFNSLSNEIRLTNALSNKVAQGSRNQIISFGDLIGGGIGGVVGGIPGAAAGAALRRTLQSTPFLTGTAVSIDLVNRRLVPFLAEFSPFVQTSILNAVRSVLSDDTPRR